jgi:TonB family protein
MLLVSLLALAGADAGLAPSGKWTVDYRADACVASRPFGDQPSSVYLAFQPILSLDFHKMRLSVLAPNTEGSGNKTGKAKIVLKPSGAVATTDMDSWESKPGGPRGYEMIVDVDNLAQLSQSTGLVIDTGKQSFSFATGKLQPVLDANAKCNDDLMRSWGVDPAARADPVGNPGEWFTDDDYPAAASQKKAQGRVIAALTVDNDGRLKACKIVASSNDPDLDQGTCDVARKNARFARKSGGDRFSIFTVHWSLGNR